MADVFLYNKVQKKRIFQQKQVEKILVRGIVHSSPSLKPSSLYILNIRPYVRQVCPFTPFIPVLGKLRQEDCHEFEGQLGLYSDF